MSIKRYTYRIVALTLALLVLATSVGVSIDVHYCQGKAKSFSLFGTAESCCQLTVTEETENCATYLSDSDAKTQLTRKKCCHNKRDLLKADQIQVASSFKLTTDSILLLTVHFSPQTVSKNSLIVYNSNQYLLTDQLPPRMRSRYILFGTFRL
jgi:hypothetical protein